MDRERRQLRAFARIDNRVSVLVVALDYSAALGIAYLAIRAELFALTIVAVVLIAGRQVAFLNLVHAAAHYTLFSKRAANNTVDLLCGYLILEPLRPYRAVHLRHHRAISLKHPDRFDYLFRHLPPTDAGLWYRTWAVIGKPICGWAGVFFIRATVRIMVENPKTGFRMAAFWGVLTVLFWWAGGLAYFLTYWLLPLLWLYPVFVFWAELSDHYGVKDDARNQRGLFYSLFLKAHEMYHAVHHRHPRIPFYRVKAASAYLRSIGQDAEETRGLIDFVRILYRPPVAR